MFRLESVALKLERAHEHARLLEQELEAWIAEQPYAASTRANSDFTRHSVIISILKPPPLQRWSLLFGDAIHNLRCALDHLVYAISVHELSADPPPNAGTCAFIINDRPEDFRSKYFRIRDLSEAVKRAIESVQPYNRQHATKPPLLAVLRDFDDIDKHRLIHVVLQRPYEFRISAAGPGMLPEDQYFESPYVDLVDGAEIAWVSCKRPNPHLRLTGRISATIGVEHRAGPDGVVRTAVERLLLADLLPEIREIVRIVSAAVQA